MKDYNHNGRIDSENELLLQEMVKDRLDESIEKHSFSEGVKGFGLTPIMKRESGSYRGRGGL